MPVIALMLLMQLDSETLDMMLSVNSGWTVGWATHKCVPGPRSGDSSGFLCMAFHLLMKFLFIMTFIIIHIQQCRFVFS